MINKANTNRAVINDRVYNILINYGYVESGRRVTGIYQHYIGFDSIEDALIHLHKSLSEAFKVACFEHNGYVPIENSFPGAALAQWILEYSLSDNNDSPGGYGCLEVMQDYGWEFPGNLVTGLAVEIKDQGEDILSTEENIRNHYRAFNGDYIPAYPVENSYPIATCLRAYTVVVNEIEKASIPEVDKK